MNLDELVSEYWPPSMFCDRSISGLPDPRGRKGANKRADRPSPCSSPRTVASKRALSRLDDKPAVGAYDVSNLWMMHGRLTGGHCVSAPAVGACRQSHWIGGNYRTQAIRRRFWRSCMRRASSDKV